MSLSKPPIYNRETNLKNKVSGLPGLSPEEQAFVDALTNDIENGLSPSASMKTRAEALANRALSAKKALP